MFNKILTTLNARSMRLLAFASGRQKYLGFVLAHNPHNVITPYVTWIWNDDFNGFAHGHYFRDQHEAIADFTDRMDSEMYIEEPAVA